MVEDYKAIARAITDLENQPHQWNDQELAEFFVSAADEIERLKGANRAFAEQVTNDYKEIKRLREALADIANIVNPYEEGDTMQEIARSALQQKDSE